MSFPVITGASATVTGNSVEFVVDVDITNATESTTIYVEYSVSGSSITYYASYSHETNTGYLYSYYFNASNLNYGTTYTFRPCLEDADGNIVGQYNGSFYIEPEATILNLTNSVSQNTVTFTVEVKYNIGLYESNYNVNVFLDLTSAANYGYSAIFQSVSNIGRIYTYTFIYSGLIYGESFKCLARVSRGTTIIDSLTNNFNTPLDTSNIIDVVFKPSVHKAKSETETTLVYLSDVYKIKITYDKNQITSTSKFKETTIHTTNLNNNEVFEITLTNLNDNTKYNCIIELYNMSVTMLPDGQLLDTFTTQFKTLNGFKLWMYLWYRL